jgi:hypothetical protein
MPTDTNPRGLVHSPTTADSPGTIAYSQRRRQAEPAECEGHPAGPFDEMGVTVYCDGSCQ